MKGYITHINTCRKLFGDKRLQLVQREVECEAVADLAQQNEVDAAACGFLVALCRLRHAVNGRGVLGGQAVFFAEPHNAVGGACFGVTVPLARARHQHHADGYRHAVGDTRKAAQLFNGMTEGVPEVEQHTLPCLVLVAAHDVALNRNADLDDVLNAVGQVLVFEEIKERRVLDAAVLDDLAHTANG